MDRPRLDELMQQARAQWVVMTPVERETMIAKQRESWARAEREWPEPRFHWENGAKVYGSYEDYCNG